MFALTGRDLGRRILDCPGGAAGFVAGAGHRGTDAVAVDPEYADGPERLGGLALREVRYKQAELTRDAPAYDWTWFGGPGRYLRLRTGAARAFVRDAAARPERYVAGSLPRLPFPDRSFDLVLSSHLLFSYGARLDEEFHRRALLGLVRVARWQVRLFPVVPHTGGARYGPLDRLRAELAGLGVPSALERVEYAFLPGASEMLVLSCAGYRAPSAGAAASGAGPGADPRAGVVDPVRWRHREDGGAGRTGTDRDGWAGTDKDGWAGTDKDGRAGTGADGLAGADGAGHAPTG